ncbi:unnamed protein product [Owenia fusiformis]|uniref:Uncharacterized protein n=1 Tax=Owenia fusiformis TaxID=6347 RepID=A0A8J1UDH6_OWEFU|nr:unnamed protein product [Owenia fusiformis]
MDSKTDYLRLLSPSNSATSSSTTATCISDSNDVGNASTTNTSIVYQISQQTWNIDDIPHKGRGRSWSTYEPNWLSLTGAAYDTNEDELNLPKITSERKSGSITAVPGVIDDQGIPAELDCNSIGEGSQFNVIPPLVIPLKEDTKQCCDAQTQTDKRKKSKWWILLLLLLLLLLIGGALTIGLYFGIVWPNSPDTQPRETTTSSRLLTAISSTGTYSTQRFTMTTKQHVTETELPTTTPLSTLTAHTTEVTTEVQTTEASTTEKRTAEVSTTKTQTTNVHTTGIHTTKVQTTELTTTEVPTTEIPTTEVSKTEVPATSKTPVTTDYVTTTVVTLFPDLSDYCFGEPDGTNAHPHMCRQFITCRNQETLIQTCAITTCYDEGMGVCIRCEAVDCGSRSTDEP